MVRGSKKDRKTLVFDITRKKTQKGRESEIINLKMEGRKKITEYSKS